MWPCSKWWSSSPVIASHTFAEKSADAVAASIAVLLSLHDHTAPCRKQHNRHCDSVFKLNLPVCETHVLGTVNISEVNRSYRHPQQVLHSVPGLTYRGSTRLSRYLVPLECSDPVSVGSIAEHGQAILACACEEIAIRGHRTECATTESKCEQGNVSTILIDTFSCKNWGFAYNN